MSLVEKLAEDLNLSPPELLRRSLAAFLERERRAVELDIADLQDRYSVRTAAELATRIQRGEIYSHPAWEDLIEWQRLEEHLQRVERWQDGLR